jgi:hypothetical protein
MPVDRCHYLGKPRTTPFPVHTALERSPLIRARLRYALVIIHCLMLLATQASAVENFKVVVRLPRRFESLSEHVQDVGGRR